MTGESKRVIPSANSSAGIFISGFWRARSLLSLRGTYPSIRPCHSMRTAFATYAQDHEASSIRRCWSTWNVLCTFLYTGEELAANPMPLVGRPKLAKPLPKALPRHPLCQAVVRHSDFPEFTF